MLAHLALLAIATSPPTIYDNAQTYPLGSRAAGMGGAYTALACDEAALHYNPASLACAGHSRVELAANAYMLQHFNAPDSLGPDFDIRATTYHPLPSIAGFVRLLDKGDEHGVGAIGFGLNISVPRSIFLVVEPPDPTQRDYFQITVRDDLLAGDIGVGWQFSKTLAFGASIGGLMRTFQSHSAVLLVRDTPTPCGANSNCFDFVSTTTDTDLLAIAGRLKAGVRWTPAPQISVGAMLSSPTLDVYGRAKILESSSVGLSGMDAMGNVLSAYGAVPVRLKGASDLGLPARFAIGFAWTSPNFILSLDLSAGLPRTTAVAHDLEQIEVEGVPLLEEPAEDTELKLGLQPNVNIGAEIGISDSIVLDVGFFTDLSSTSEDDLRADRADRIHMFGGSFALGLIGRQARSWFGLSFEAGSGTTRVLSQEFTFDQVAAGNTTSMESSYSRWSLVGIIGSSYSFVEDDELPPEPTN